MSGFSRLPAPRGIQGRETTLINHPNRSRNSADAAIRRLLNNHSLARIEITASSAGFALRAFPDSFHPEVARRREAAFAGRSDVSLPEASKIQEAAIAPVAQATERTLEAAIQSLAAALGPQPA